MSQVDALRMVENVRSRLVDLAVAENYFREKSLSDAVRNVWAGSSANGGLVSELWVEGAFPGELSSDSLDALRVEGIFPEELCRHLEERGVFPVNRLLYKHQAEAVRECMAPGASRPALVITAGTGLGKTEAFLASMLADLWRAPERRHDGGMRCLILYPMNALIVDQVERIYGWLKGQRRLTVFHFTSETPEDARIANKRGEPEWEPCRMRTRQEARGFETHDGQPITEEPFAPVPDIVITNYSMLEYMLCRPQDRRFFGLDLRCIVLDEAHLYSGSLAGEIAMLLRRVRERCGVLPEKVLHLATSATLGGDDCRLRQFASELFSTNVEQTRIIRGRYSGPKLGEVESPPESKAKASEIAHYATTDLVTLTSGGELVTNDENTVRTLCDVARHLVAPSIVERAATEHPRTPAQFLHIVLREAPLARLLASTLSNASGNVLSLDDLSACLFDGEHGENERNATITLLRLLAVARTRASDLPLVPHRLHFLVRAPEGLSICLNPNCSGPKDRRIACIGCIQPYSDRCSYCDHVVLPVHRCDNCGEWALAAHENRSASTLEPGYYSPSLTERTYYLLTGQHDHDLEEVVLDSEQGEILGCGSNGVTLSKAPRQSADSSQECPTCHSIWSNSPSGKHETEWRQTCRALVGGRPFALSVTTETVLHDLPPYHEPSRHWKPGQGRRLLCFSDSRASAARLGPLLTQQHEIQLVRAAMARCAGGLTSSDTSAYLAGEIDRLTRQLAGGVLEQGLRRLLEQELVNTREKLERSKAGTPFVDFAALVGERDEMAELLHRELAEKHNAKSFGEKEWNDNKNAVKKRAEALVAKELQRPLKRQTSVESTGMIEVVYPGIQLLDVPPILEERLPSKLRQSISQAWTSILTLLLDTVRADGCVDWSKDNDGRKWLDESPLQGRWLTRTRAGWGARAFVGATISQVRRQFIQNVLCAAGVSREHSETLSEDLLCAAFDQLRNNAQQTGFSWLRTNDYHQTGPEEADKAIQILFDHLCVRSPSSLFWCEATGTVWSNNALGWVPIDGCLGTVREVARDFLDKDPRWGRARREFLGSSILGMGLWAEEHSAQLSPQENRRLQDLFKNGIRNVLSSTTTMELGIDIGGLNGVLLGNVPPGPANHRQRAGRAGRRSDGSAIVVTYSRDSDYDRQVFLRFGDFLRRELRKPTVFLDRSRVIRRHLHAVLLSEFLRERQPDRTGAMHAFGKMGSFCGLDSVPERWSHSTKSRPSWQPGGIDVSAQFLEFLNNIKTSDRGFRSRCEHLTGRTGLCKIGDLREWREFVLHATDAFKKAIDEWKEDIDQLRQAWETIPRKPQRDVQKEMAKANSIGCMARALSEITVIEWLADHRFLPRYGFPVNLQSLTVRRPIERRQGDHSEPDERYRLERSSLLALKEYVPESQVLVGGRVATSRGLRKHWTDSNVDQALGLQYFALRCAEDHVYVRQSPEAPCPRCQTGPRYREQLVLPRFGYTTAAWDEMPQGTNLERIGEQSVCPLAFTEHGKGETVECFGGLNNVRVTYQEEAELLVRNSGRNRYGFAICTRCGFAMSEVDSGMGRIHLPPSFEAHASVFAADAGSFCWKKDDVQSPVLRNRVLAARQLTDMLLIEWPDATLSMYNGVYSLGRALMLAGACLLEMDEREVGMELIPLRSPALGIVIYDVSPGGTGHCSELLRLSKEWVEAAYRVLYVDEKHHSRCRKACLDCILDFSGQYAASHLNRLSALSLLQIARSV